MLTTFVPNTDGRTADAHLRPSGRRNLRLAEGLAPAHLRLTTFVPNTDGRTADAHLRPSGRRNLRLAEGLAPAHLRDL